MECRICKGNCQQIVKTFDFMATREPFTYRICSECGTWQIETIPDNLSDYYAADYYSYDVKQTPQSIQHFRAVAQDIIKGCKLTEDMSVLDYGAGSVQLLKALYDNGVGENGALYKLRAYDKFAPECNYNGIKLQNTLPTDMLFDCILSKHCIEHEIDPRVQITNILKLLSPDGFAVFVAPNPDSINAQYFKGYWIGIDGPRHINIMPMKAFSELVIECGGEVKSMSTIGEAGMFLSSDFYLKGGMWKDREKNIQEVSNQRFMDVHSYSSITQEMGMADVWTATIKKRRNN